MDYDFLVQHAMTPSSRQRLELKASLRRRCWCHVLDNVKICELACYTNILPDRICCQQEAIMQLGLTLGNTYFWAGKSCCCHVSSRLLEYKRTLPLDNNHIFGTEWFCFKYHRGDSDIVSKTFPSNNQRHEWTPFSISITWPKNKWDAMPSILSVYHLPTDCFTLLIQTLKYMHCQYANIPSVFLI